VAGGPAHRWRVPVELEHTTYEDETKSIADTDWWEPEDRNERRVGAVRQGDGSHLQPVV
jgi:hypothetical protein